jgi:hypothetical protein
VTYRDFDGADQCSFPGVERRCSGNAAQVCTSAGTTKVWQNVQDCVQSMQLCQPSTGVCCTPTNGTDQTETAGENHPPLHPVVSAFRRNVTPIALMSIGPYSA